MKHVFCPLIAAFSTLSSAYKYDPAWVQWNLNQAQNATDPLDYWGQWAGHAYTASPANWRMPTYTIFLDRFVNGDPTNDNINGTYFEHDPTSNQMRHGGDLQGLIDTLDYLQGMGIKVLYLAGSPFINAPWGYDQYSPLDLTLLDQHFGTLQLWQSAIDQIHARGMYVVLDNTYGTLGDLVGFEGYLNSTAPFTLREHKVEWKSSRVYHDFNIGNTYNATCTYPRFWLDNGYPVNEEVTIQMNGCYDSEFDQYGDTEAFGVFPDWRRELSKFASVQDRLRDWYAPTRAKLENFYCMMIAQLDIDGYRFDKATQATIDSMAFMSSSMRTCAARFNKNNFFLPGEITGGNIFGAIFLGRGRQPNQVAETALVGANMTNTSADHYFLRESGLNGLDAAAFHYSVYRTMTRFLGMDGNLESSFDAPSNWVDMWNDLLMTNDMVNPSTGLTDPRHMYGVTNQDNFRWPGVTDGVQRTLLGQFITTIMMPGIPLLLWGEEQAFYIFDNTATNYIFGRQPLSSAPAWMIHGCYSFATPSTQFYHMPVDAARHGCNDPTVAYDHRDPSHPVRNIMKHMFSLRSAFPVLNDGYYLQQLSNMTHQLFLPGSGPVPSERGLWSVVRMEFAGAQDLSTAPAAGNQPVWLIYSNENHTVTYTFDCTNNGNNGTDLNTTALISPFASGTTVRNLFYPFDSFTLVDSPRTLNLTNGTGPNGCYGSLTLDAYFYGAYVPLAQWVAASPMITGFQPGHDAHILSNVTAGNTESVVVQLQFSVEMSCDSVTQSISFNSTSEYNPTLAISGTPQCTLLQDIEAPAYVGGIPTLWTWTATVTGFTWGVHRITVNDPKAQSGNGSTGAVDHFLIRIGPTNNPIVFPLLANYSSSLLSQNSAGDLTVTHQASGADQWRYSTNWGTSFSDWMPYTGGQSVIQPQAWSGTKAQQWTGQHVRVEYYSRLTASSDFVVQGDLDDSQIERRFPHMWLNGPYNLWGYDAGLPNQMENTANSTWEKHFMTEWKADGTLAQINVWGMNPDGQPDQTLVFGDADGDSVLDRLPPSSLTAVAINITAPPIKPYLGWRIVVNDGNLRFTLLPSGSMWPQIVLYILLWIVPVLAAALSVWLYMQSFYGVKFNQIGIKDKVGFIPLVFKKPFQNKGVETQESPHMMSLFKPKSKFQQNSDVLANVKRRTVLIATMEYDIEDWEIKIKIGGLGVMAQLMGKNLGHQDLVWVVPCVGGIDYPIDNPADSMSVTIMGQVYEIGVQYHTLRNITYVLLDAPVFRQQTKTEPYPSRMDDMTSAIYYSAWNQCIAETIKRFPVDLYHINDYHGSIAPLYLLPNTIPAALSLHNAEFQGLWPMRTKQERDEVCSVFNLPSKVAQNYVQFGEVFNLLHAGASYLRIHQDGFGAVGVSRKYGKRAYARYPIFWGLKKVGKLPNPDPSDTGEWDKKLPKASDIRVDQTFEVDRADLRKQAQEWAGLNIDANAELFVFVGRWSMQKGIDLIADIFPSVLEQHPNTQLIAVGPVIDLYGRFAAAKLDKIMQKYPGRVYSKPEFTALPPFIFSGAEFALIPSRDEPFGLVAVEFGRKGALGVGARVGGLGQMPGWWYTVESTTTEHLLHQFKLAIDEALRSKTETRALMRARSAKQRFPVAQWVEDLEILQSTAIRIHDKVESSHKHKGLVDTNTMASPTMASPTMSDSRPQTPTGLGIPLWPGSRNSSSSALSTLGNRLKHLSANLSKDNLSVSETPKPARSSGLSRQVSLGSRRGPGHVRTAKVDNRLSAVHDAEEPPDFESDDSDSTEMNDGEHMWMPGQVGTNRRRTHHDTSSMLSVPGGAYHDSSSHLPLEPPSRTRSPSGYESPGTPPLGASTGLLPPAPAWSDSRRVSAAPSVLSVDTVLGEKTDFKLQKVDPFFTDTHGEYLEIFERKLRDLNGKNSIHDTCIEEYLIKSEKRWFDDFRNAKLGRVGVGISPRTSFEGRDSRAQSVLGEAPPTLNEDYSDEYDEANDEFLLGRDYKAPTGTRYFMQLKIGDWPIYTLFLAFGQIIAANSYQITLLTGQNGESAGKLYSIASVYLVASVVWWLFYRRFQAVVCLSVPFVFYGFAFVLIGSAHWAGTPLARGWIQNIGSGLYAVASASGSIFFSLNFGDEGSAQQHTWVLRACLIQGTQQIYVVALWYWGSVLSKRSLDGISTTNDGFANTWQITAVCMPIAAVFWACGLIMWFGLPRYYRQQPGKMPNFYNSLIRRKIVIWFFVTVLVQNFFLSAPYGRNWSFLFSSYHAKTWQVILLIGVFFIGVWAVFLWIMARLSKSHSWILPLFAIGLGAPRWAQIWWGTSNIGAWLPWAGGYTSSALVSRALWLWLGVLDAIQGVGLGMILLTTLTRVHVAFTLVTAQVLGSLATIVARACAPNKIGPGPISPDITESLSTMWQAWFWIGLSFNLAICIGYFMFYRKEQLQKP